MPAANVLQAAALGLAASVLLALAVWAVSLFKRDVSIVDAAWAFLVLLPALVVAYRVPQIGPRAPLVLGLAAAWALRLSGYIVWRQRGQPEDRRYQAIRLRNEPHFKWKSVYLVFGLQAVLGSLVATPLMGASASSAPWNVVDVLGAALALFGLLFEATADAQLARFRADPRSAGQVMDRGLWRYSRHPNYFGECCVWWGFWLLAAGAGAWWTVLSPLLMTLLLMKVSGVPLLEEDLRRQRPGYAAYRRRTPAFFPWWVRE